MTPEQIKAALGSGLLSFPVTHFDAQGRYHSGPEPAEQNALYAAENAYVTLMAGFTTVQSVGSPRDKALRAVKETSPGATITLLATPGGASAAPLLPWVDDVIVWRPVWQDLGHLPFELAREL